MRPAESFIQQPVRSLQTMLRVLSELDGAFPIVIPDGIYSANTMEAVSYFQRSRGIPATGITDQNTWEQIVKDYELALIEVEPAAPIEILIDPGQVFALGARGPYILLLQGLLTQLSYDHETINAPGSSGVLDADTSRSILAFQTLSGLPQTGTLDKVTWKNLVNQFTLSAHRQAGKKTVQEPQYGDFVPFTGKF